MLDAVFSLLGFAQNAIVLPSESVLEIPSPPQLVGEALTPSVKAESVIVMDVASGSILYSKNAQEKKPIASLTKLATALVVRENYALDDVVVVSKNAAAQPAAKVWLLNGEEIKVENLLKALLIESGNDAAVALAENMGSEKEFIEAMNAKMEKLGLKNTHFENPVGYDAAENYSTAYDIARLAGYFLRDAVLREIVATNKTSVYSTDGLIKHELYSTNNLFGSYLTIKGLKTGLTDDAGECIAALAENEENGKQVLAIVLNSPNRMQESKALLTWALQNFRW